MATLSGTAPRKSMSDLQKEPGRRTRVNSEDDVEEKYKIGKELGRGSFGVVSEAKQLSTGQVYAVKLIQKERGTQMELIEREVSILQCMDHQNIIHLEEVLETPKKIYLVLELCLGGELSDVIKDKGPFSEEDARVIIKRLADALAYMHLKGMVHRDLKLENILVTGEDPLNVKITDFGLAYQMQKGVIGEDGHTLDGTCGTLLYMAPEVLENKLAYSDHCDVWSLGVIMYEILCGAVPFYESSPSKLEELIKCGQLTFSEPQWSSISEQAKNLISRMLQVDTTRRLRAGEVLNDRWILGKANSDYKDIFELMMEATEPANGLDSPEEQYPSTQSTAVTEEKDDKPKSKDIAKEKKLGDNLKVPSNQMRPKKVFRSTTVSSVSSSSTSGKVPRRLSDSSAYSKLKPSSSYSSIKDNKK